MRSRRYEGLVVAIAFAVGLSVLAWGSILAGYPRTQGGDGPFFHHMAEATRIAWVRWHELPLWNPYQCGGVPLWDNPQGIGAAPVLWALLPFGVTRAIELWYVVHTAAAFLFMWIFARSELRASQPAALVAASIWAFCGYVNQHLSGGHFTWVTFLYMPLALWLWRRAEEDMRAAVGMGILVAWEMHEGGNYALPHFILILGAETLTRVWPPARIRKMAIAGAVVVLVGVTLSASRLLPVMDQLRTHKRGFGEESDALQWSTLRDMFLARTHDRNVAGQQYVWPEYGDYIGPILLGLSFVGLLIAGTEWFWVIALLAYSFALLAGNAGKFAPWSILRAHVYPFKEMRVPGRFNAEVTLFLAALVALGMDRLVVKARAWFRSRRRSEAFATAVIALAFIGVGDMIAVGISWSPTQFVNGPASEQIEASPRLYLAGPGQAQFIDLPRQNRGRLECWEEWAFEQGAALWAGDVPQARAATSDAVVENVTRTQNTFSFDVDASAPARIRLNGSWDRGWRTNVGTTADDDRLLAVDVPAGRNHVIVKYWPHGLTAGFIVSFAALAGVVAFYVIDARRRRRLRAPQ
jgi:hypothetical protein